MCGRREERREERRELSPRLSVEPPPPADVVVGAGVHPVSTAVYIRLQHMHDSSAAFGQSVHGHPPTQRVSMHAYPPPVRCVAVDLLRPFYLEVTHVLRYSVCDTQPARPVPVRCGVHIQGRYLTDREGCLMTKGIVYGSSVYWTVMRAFLTRGS